MCVWYVVPVGCVYVYVWYSVCIVCVWSVVCVCGIRGLYIYICVVCVVCVFVWYGVHVGGHVCVLCSL